MHSQFHETFLGSHDFTRVLQDLEFTCLDVGARGGFVDDLRPLSPYVNAIGFEPDEQECERLNATLAAQEKTHPWRSLRYIPVALGKNGRERILNIYHKRGCSSFFEADIPLAKAFGRDDNFLLEGQVCLTPETLDKAARLYDFSDVVFLKTDVQGAELEIFRSASRLLNRQILAIRTEVEFIPLYKEQPLFSEIEMHLRKKGFIPMGFVQLHHWRRSTRRKHPQLDSGPIPYSRGQIVHGDMLFFRDPRQMPDDTPEAIAALLKMAFLAITYEYVDHAVALLKRPAVLQYLTRYNIDVDAELHEVSCYLYHQYMRSVWHRRKSDVRHYLARKINRIKPRFA